MTIRTITLEEAPEFLEILCRVFDLNQNQVGDVFYKEPMFDLNRKWAVFDSGRLVSIMSTVPLEFGWGRAFGIMGVGTVEDRRGEGLAARMLEHVLKAGREQGEGAAYLFAKAPALYERVGFKVVDEVIRGDLDRIPESEVPALLDTDQVERRYEEWSSLDPNRLRRDARRWRYWRWNLRVCTEFGDGYLCSEAGLCREAVIGSPRPGPWETPDNEWLGLKSMTEMLGVPLIAEEFDLYLMACGGPAGSPQMFMTDQF